MSTLDDRLPAPAGASRERSAAVSGSPWFPMSLDIAAACSAQLAGTAMYLTAVAGLVGYRREPVALAAAAWQIAALTHLGTVVLAGLHTGGAKAFRSAFF